MMAQNKRCHVKSMLEPEGRLWWKGFVEQEGLEKKRLELSKLKDIQCTAVARHAACADHEIKRSKVNVTRLSKAMG